MAVCWLVNGDRHLETWGLACTRRGAHPTTYSRSSSKTEILCQSLVGMFLSYAYPFVSIANVMEVTIYLYNTRWVKSRYTIQVSQEECARLLEGVPYVKVYRYNPKHLCPKLNGYGDNGQRSLKL